MEARATALGMPGKLKFIYPTNGGVSAATASALVAAGIAPARVMMECVRVGRRRRSIACRPNPTLFKFQ